MVEGLCRTGIIGAFTMIPPSEMVLSLWRLLRTGQVPCRHGPDAGRGGPGGGLVDRGWPPWPGPWSTPCPGSVAGVDPLLAAYYSVPVFVFYPMFIVIFGLNAIPKVSSGSCTRWRHGHQYPERLGPGVRSSSRRPGCSGWGRLATASGWSSPAPRPTSLPGSSWRWPTRSSGWWARSSSCPAGDWGTGSFAYHDFKPTMYALILLILTVVITVNMALYVWEQAHGPAGCTMTARSPPFGEPGRMANPAGGVLRAWQLAHHLAGEIAMTAPLDTFRHTRRLVGRPTSGPTSTGRGPRSRWPCCWPRHRVVIGAILGFHRLSGEVAEPILVARTPFPRSRCTRSS